MSMNDIGDDHLTPGAFRKADAIKGMAFFSGTGPNGKTCGDCKLRGYTRQSDRGRWSEIYQMTVYPSRKVQACQKYLSMTGRQGPDVKSDHRSCKYFEQK